MAKLYANENFPSPVVGALRKLGHDILTVQETGKAGQAVPDEDVLAFASEQRRVLLTLNRKHFIQLHARSPGHAGIIVCTFDPDFAAQAQPIHDALSQAGNVAGQLVRVNRPPPAGYGAAKLILASPPETELMTNRKALPNRSGHRHDCARLRPWRAGCMTIATGECRTSG